MFRHPNHQQSSNGTSKDFSLEDKIQQSIRYYKVPATKDKSDVLNLLMAQIASPTPAIKKETKIRQLYFTVSSVAAAACLLLFLLYNFFAFETYTGVPQCANVYFLPDHSRVVLTEGSELKFPRLAFNRDVQLKGEAYFEVQHGTDFYVKTREGGVMVLGTRFNVSDLNNRFAVHCYEGTVGVDYGKEKIRIEKGNDFNGSKQAVNVIDDQNLGYPEYALFKHDFNNESLAQVWPVVESFFGVKINAQFDPQKKFTGSIHTGNLEEVMEIICIPMQLKFKLDKKGKEVKIVMK
jgi:hypothetical protein